MKQRGNTLAATMIAIVIIMILVAVFFFGGFGRSGGATGAPTASDPGARKDGLGITVPGRVRYAAKDDECRSDLDQVRQFIALKMNSGEEDKPPASIDEIGAPKSVLSCPVGHEPYQYDPSSGKVHCPHPGHEKF